MEQSYSASLCMFIQMLNLILITGLTPRLVTIVLKQPYSYLPQVSRLLWNQNDCCSSLSIREQLLEASWVKGSQELLRIHMGCHRNKSLQQSWVAPVSPSSCPTPSPAPLLPAFYLLHHYLACSSRPIGNQLWLYSAAATCRNMYKMVTDCVLCAPSTSILQQVKCLPLSQCASPRSPVLESTGL